MVKDLQPYLGKLLAQASETKEIHWSPSNLASTTKFVTPAKNLEVDKMTFENLLGKIGLPELDAQVFFSDIGGIVNKDDLQKEVEFEIEYHATFGASVGPHHTIYFKMNVN